MDVPIDRMVKAMFGLIAIEIADDDLFVPYIQRTTKSFTCDGAFPTVLIVLAPSAGNIRKSRAQTSAPRRKMRYGLQISMKQVFLKLKNVLKQFQEFSVRLGGKGRFQPNLRLASL